jgi:hypothetical protein
MHPSILKRMTPEKDFILKTVSHRQKSVPFEVVTSVGNEVRIASEHRNVIVRQRSSTYEDET